MAANNSSKSKELERSYMRGPHSSESAEQTAAAEKTDLPDPVKQKTIGGFPTSVYFIISNEFCERFTYYGMKAILTLYLLNGLGYDQSTTVTIYHAFAMLCYFTPIFGGMIADVWWGKYLTIVILSIVYAIGNCSTAFTSFDNLPIDVKKIGCFTGLLLIGIGTGGIKPCVSSFGADQIPEDQPKIREKFFSAFYFAINAGSMLSMIITPILRTEVECGGGPCFPLAFGVPAGLMLVAIVIFLIGTPLYIRTKPKGNVLVEVFKCIGRAIKNWSKYRKTSPKPALLDYADDKYSHQFIEDVRACKRIIIMMLPVPVFWALFDQTGSTWTLQGQKMDGTLIPGVIYILPDQFQVINPVLVMIMIPLFQAFIYPCFIKCKLCLPNRLLQRMAIGGIFAALAFVAAAAVQFVIEPTAYKEASHGNGWIHLISADPQCSFRAPTYSDSWATPYSSSPVALQVPLDVKTLNYVTANCTSEADGTIVQIEVPDRTTRALIYHNKTFLQVDSPNPFADATGKARVLWVNSLSTFPKNHVNFVVRDNVDGATWTFNSTVFQAKGFTELSVGEHSFSVNVSDTSGGYTDYKIAASFNNGIDSASILTLYWNGTEYAMVAVQELPAKTYSMFWMVPQYVILTAAEILFSISGLDFAYSQAPTSMRSVMMAVWLLTVAFGNLIVMILAEIQLFPPPGMSLFYAVLMAADIAVFALMAYFYVYVDQVEGEKGKERSASSSSRGSVSGTPPPRYPDSERDVQLAASYENSRNYSPSAVDEETNLPTLTEF